MIVGVVLAGGRSTRFGADKALAEFGGASLFDRVRDVLARGCERIATHTKRVEKLLTKDLAGVNWCHIVLRSFHEKVCWSRC